MPHVPSSYFQYRADTTGPGAGNQRYLAISYRDAMARAANWLVETQDADGCWRSAPTPLAVPGEKAYETHVSWGLFEAARVSGRQSWGAAGLRQVRWAVSKLQPNGWMADCCMSDPRLR